MCLISVIIPVYNARLYLERCLDSIINQTFRDIEIICINDGSTDESLSILERYALLDSRVIVVNQINQGVSAARNEGLNRATGEYISFVDSDDELVPDAYERLMSVTWGDIDAIMFGTNLLCVDGSTPSTGEVRYLGIPVVGHCSIDDNLLVRLSVYPWNKLYRRKSIEKFSLRFPTGCLYEDAVFFYCFFSVCKSVYFIKDKLYIYKLRNDSIMGLTRQKKDNHGIFHILIFDYIYKFWTMHKVFKGRENVFCERFAEYIKLAFNSSPNHEQARCVWEATRRLREWDIDTVNYPLLDQLKHGNYAIEAGYAKIFPEHDTTDKKLNYTFMHFIKGILYVYYILSKFFSKITKGDTRRHILCIRYRIESRLNVAKEITTIK